MKKRTVSKKGKRNRKRAKLPHSTKNKKVRTINKACSCQRCSDVPDDVWARGGYASDHPLNFSLGDGLVADFFTG